MPNDGFFEVFVGGLEDENDSVDPEEDEDPDPEVAPDPLPDLLPPEEKSPPRRP